MRTQLVIALIAAIAAQPPHGSSTQSLTGTIEGRVIRPDGTGIYGAAVSIGTGTLLPPPVSAMPTSQAGITATVSTLLDGLINRDGKIQQKTTTDATGHFVLNGVAVGEYTLLATADGYFGRIKGSQLWLKGIDAQVSVQDGKRNDPVNLVLHAAGVISGRIQSPLGNPGVAFVAAAFSLDYTTPTTSLRAVESRKPDEQGRYRLFNLPPGKYIVGAVPIKPGARGLTGRLETPEDSWAVTYYTNVVDARLSPLVAIADGVEVPGIDINAKVLTTFNVSGRMRLEGSASDYPAPTQFKLTPVGAHSLKEGLSSSIGFRNVLNDPSNSNFKIAGVPPGEYLLEIEGQEPASRFHGQTMVRVEKDNVDVGFVSLKLPRSIDARVVDESHSPLSADSLRKSGSAGLPIAVRGFDSDLRGSVAIQPDGRLRISNLFEGAKYKIVGNGLVDRVSLSNGYYLKDIRQNGASVMETGFFVDSSADLELVLGNNGGTVRGNVTGPSMIGAYRAVLIPAKDSQRNNPALYYSVSIVNKSFVFSSVAPGEYKLFVWDIAPQLYEEQNADFIALYEAKGKLLAVENGVSTDVEVSPIAYQIP
jgi:hypothetical protein